LLKGKIYKHTLKEGVPQFTNEIQKGLVLVEITRNDLFEIGMLKEQCSTCVELFTLDKPATTL